MSNTHSHDIGIGGALEPEVVDGGWIRDDVPVIPVSYTHLTLPTICSV